MRTIQKVLLMFCCGAAVRLPLAAATVTEPIWRESIEGSPIAAPVTAPEAVFITGDNKAIQAFHRSGRLLWRTYFKYKLLPEFTITSHTFIYVTDNRHNLHALNRNGTELWTQQLTEPLFCPPAAGRDGRLYLTFSNRIECRTFSGRRKWVVPLDAEPVHAPLLNSDGGISILLKDRTFFMISPFGEKSTAGTVSSAAEQCRILPAVIPGRADTKHTILAAEPGRAVCHDFAANTETENQITICWETVLNGTPLAINATDKTIGIITNRGILHLIDAVDGAALATISLPVFSTTQNAVLQPVWLSCFRDTWYSGSPAGISAVTSAGTVAWTFRTAKNRTTPVMSAEGDIYTAGSDWILYAYRAETRIQDPSPILSKENISLNIAGYASAEAGTFFCDDEWRVSKALARIEASLQDGSSGSSEPEDTKRLAEIAGDTGKDPADNHPLLDQREKACLLLGMTGSEDARILLCTILENETNPVILRSALQGLAMISMDFQGKSITAVKKMLAESPVRADESVLLTACDTVYSISHAMGTPIMKQGISCLSDMMNLPFSSRVRKKAAETLQKLAQ